jgi:hypothetical protein
MFHIAKTVYANPPRNGKFYCLAVDGRGASGKSVLAQHLRKLLPDFLILPGDDYFEPTPGRLEWGDFNDQRFMQDVIEPLRNGPEFLYRPYDWHAEPHISEKRLSASNGFCLERCFSFTFDLDWDLKIWVETPKEICLERALLRESLPRELVLKVWQDVWQPQEDKYISERLPKEAADVVLDGTRPFETQIDV